MALESTCFNLLGEKKG